MESTQKVEEVPKVEEEKKDYADIIFNYDDENKKCVDCGACASTCPNNAISAA